MLLCNVRLIHSPFIDICMALAVVIVRRLSRGRLDWIVMSTRGNHNQSRSGDEELWGGIGIKSVFHSRDEIFP